MATLYPPYIIERSSRGERTYDIFSRLLMDRIIFLGTPINDDVANLIIAQLLFLDADNPERDMDRDRFMSAEEAKAYGLIDSVFTPRRELVPHANGKDGRGVTAEA